MFGKKEKIKFNKYLDFWINEKSFIAGTGLIAVIALTGVYISQSVLIRVDSLYTPLLTAVFCGVSAGHFLGVSTEKEGKTMASFGMGAFLSLTLVLMALFSDVILSGILLTSLITFWFSPRSLKDFSAALFSLQSRNYILSQSNAVSS